MLRKLAVCCLVPFLAVACSPRTEQEGLTIKGSDTMVQLGQRWAELYMDDRPNINIQVTGGGSGTGIAALINGSTDIAQASRTMREEEKVQAREQRGNDVVETAVALDALAVYIHVDNPVDSLSIPQLSGIFRGEITNWSEVGGVDAPIILYGRENSSGTYAFFREHVMGNADFGGAYQSLPGTAAVINAVSQDPAGVGYGGIGYVSGVNTISIRTEGEEDPIEPTMENVLTNRYPLSRSLYFYTIGEPDGLMAEFIEWVLSQTGQEIVTEVGYYPLASGAAPL